MSLLCEFVFFSIVLSLFREFGFGFVFARLLCEVVSRICFLILTCEFVL